MPIPIAAQIATAANCGLRAVDRRLCRNLNESSHIAQLRMQKGHYLATSFQKPPRHKRMLFELCDRACRVRSASTRIGEEQRNGTLFLLSSNRKLRRWRL